MTDREIKLSKNYEEFYPKNYKRKNNFKKEEKEANKSNNDSGKKNVSFKEYVPKKRILTQQIHPLEKDKESYFPKHKSKFSKEKPSKKEEKYEKENYDDEEEEDDYSGLAGDNYYYKNYKTSKWRNKRRSEDTNDFKAKWKTEMCHYWEMYGFCKYGDSCAFAHGMDELNKRKMSSNYKTKPCKQFFELGYCTYGVRCQFSHKLLKECEEKNDEETKEEVSYLKILQDFNNSSNQISHEILKRPRLMTFEDIASCTLDEKEKNRLELYEDILAVKKKSDDPEHVFSDDTNDGNSENNGKNENNEKEDKKDEEKNNNNETKETNDNNENNDNEKNKRARFVSI